MSVRVRRIYEPPEPDDGLRVLVDRLWPRGLAKDAAHVDEWPKGLTPSGELRTWYHAGEGLVRGVPPPLRGGTRRAGGRRTDRRPPEVGPRGSVTLLTASKNPDRSHASVLAELLKG